MPGGVNSPVRAFRAVGGDPLYFSHGKGSRLFDADGSEYIDYVCSWGAIIHGHADDLVNEAIGEAASRGTSYGAPHEGEIKLAEEVLARLPHIERVRFVNSGTEATLAAVRLARAATGRTKILKFIGNYHGAVDSLLAKAGSGVATFSLPDSAGVPSETTSSTLLAPYNDLEAVARLLSENRDTVAALLVEPIAGNMGLVPPHEGFLQGLRKLCDEYGVLLVLDEVMTGFRVARGGAAELYSVQPDLICLGKVIGGGLPVGAYGGSRELMDWVAPVGPMYQAGTLSGNPLAMAAGLSAVSRLSSESYEQLETIGARLETGLKQIGVARSVPLQVQRVGSMISVFFNNAPVIDLDTAQSSDKELFGRVFHKLLDSGIYLPPSALESWFFSLSHTNSDIDRTIEAFDKALGAVA